MARKTLQGGREVTQLMNGIVEILQDAGIEILSLESRQTARVKPERPVHAMDMLAEFSQ